MKTAHTSDDMENKAPFLEKLVFHNRIIIIILFLLATGFLGYQAMQVRPNASFEKMIPQKHPYVANYITHKDDLKGLGNNVRIAVEATEGDIFDPQYLETLRRINDTVFFIPGVDRAGLKSLWTPLTRWLEVTKEGFDGGPVIPDDYNGSPESIDKLRRNVHRSGEIGKLVANNFKSTIINVPLMSKDPETGKPINYQEFSKKLENEIREKYQSEKIKIHITGFAKLVGDLIDGASQVVLFFGITIVITLVLLYFFSRCIRSTLIPVLCSLIAVMWQLGILKTVGYGLDPYSMLVPFLIFAIGTSHGVQMINSIENETAKGNDKLMAARYTFRSLYIPAMTALVTNAIGFITLLVIQIDVIQELAIGATLGVAVLILTNIVILPVIFSYTGVSPNAVIKIKAAEQKPYHVWRAVSYLSAPKPAMVVTAATAAILGGSIYASQWLNIGDLDKGAPELYPHSRYNMDNKFITDNYSTSSDVFVVMVKTPKEKNGDYKNLVAMDRLEMQLKMMPEVQSVVSLAGMTKLIMSAYAEGNLKWMALNRNQETLDATVIKVPPGFSNEQGTLSPMIVFLTDHEAGTLDKVVRTVEAFASKNNTNTSQFLLAAGNAGIEAATNIVIAKSHYRMMFLVFAIVAFLCLITFRSVQGMICVIIPLTMTSFLCHVVMIILGIGVKVATLPVIALGVGIGVDYGIYIYSKYQTYRRDGLPIRESYFNTLKTTGKAVCFTGITLAVGVGMWGFSAIKFQSDMGILLAFMFLANMLGAIIILPALIGLFSRVRAKEAEKEFRV